MLLIVDLLRKKVVIHNSTSDKNEKGSPLAHTNHFYDMSLSNFLMFQVDEQLLPSNGAWSLPGLHLYRGGLGWGWGLPQHTIDDMRLDGGKVQLSAI